MHNESSSRQTAAAALPSRTAVAFHSGSLPREISLWWGNTAAQPRTIGKPRATKRKFHLAVALAVAGLGTALLSQPAVGAEQYYMRRVVLCTTTNMARWGQAILVQNTINLNGQNVRVDSFDSSNPAYSTDGKYDPDKARDNGHVATNSRLVDSAQIGNANIFGKLSTGPGGTPSIGSQGMVGDTAWQADSSHTGQIQPGWWEDDMNFDFTEVQVPAALYSGLPPESGSSGLLGDLVNALLGNETYDMVLTSGDYRLPSGGQALDGRIYVAGHCRLLVQSSINLSGTDKIVLATNASLQLYVDCPTASISGSSIVNPGQANNFYYYGTSQNTSLSIQGNGEIMGVIYAPNADLSFGGGGNGDTDFSGAIIGKSLSMNGHFSVHYDESLRQVPHYRGYVVTSWNEQ